MGFNMWIGVGRLGGDPVGRKFENATTHEEEDIATYSLAINEGYGEFKKTVWVACICYGGLARSASQFLQKGSQVAVMGKLRTTSYRAKDGKMVYKTEVVVQKQEFLTFGKVEGNYPQQAEESESNTVQSKTPPTAPDDGFIDIPDGVEQDLPFR